MSLKSKRKLKQVIAVRHGEYDRMPEKLNSEGVAQIERLSERLKGIIKSGHKVRVLTSPHLRATQSAKILAKQLQVEIEEVFALGLAEFGDGQHQMDEVIAKSGGLDVIVAVTHFVAPSGIIDALSKKFFSKTVFEGELEVQKGDGIMICLKTGTVTKSLFANQQVQNIPVAQ